MPIPEKLGDIVKDILKKSPIKDPEALKSIFTQDVVDFVKKNKLAPVETKKTFNDLLFNFFGMNEHWSFGRNLLGGFMVHCPEYPTYFIPAYTQAKSTGDAKDLKKGEGPRGLITGGLEGIAVGALVSGEFLKPREMGPYIILGAALQLFSSTVFPWLGEKMGRQIYNKKMQNLTDGLMVKLDNIEKPNPDQSEQKTSFTGVKRHNIFNSGRMKI